MSIFSRFSALVSWLPQGKSRVSLFGILTGLLLATLASLEPGILSNDAIARVNSVPILKSDYQSHLRALSADKRNNLTEADRKRVLDRLIEEELLVQRAQQLNFTRVDKKVRSTLARASIEHIINESRAKNIKEADLERFYLENQDFFKVNSQAWVKRIYFKMNDNKASVLKKAGQAMSALKQGQSFDEVKKQYGDNPVMDIPPGLLPVRKLVDYLGPALVEKVQQMKVTEVSHPLESNGAIHILLVVRARQGVAPSFKKIRDLVEEEFRKRSDDLALKEYLVWLKKTNNIEYY